MSGGTIQGMIVQPYIGERYGKEKPFGPSVLVLGESSYTDTLPVRAPLPSDWNRRIIACVKDRQQDPTITRAVGVFYGGFRDFDQRWEFWQTATFANFVQNNIGRSRKRPTDEDWQGGAACFQEYLDELHPEFVLALGAELWPHLPKSHFRSDCEPVQLQSEDMPSFVYRHSGGHAFVFGIDHPMAYGWSYAKWTPWVQAALKSAVSFHTTPQRI
jgi:hypothetical protein